ncbi:pentapeptide repeat-containing protein [Kosakonia sacchari]|uniref:Pentapeptide repeat-containing protein n=1 Tax=Kosakonia sacchari TaxID=1158459 RepID=A0ABZ0MR27_9ENTR|nr:pentapeptide repeat-containing protein [Kosakonia sacchari]WOZ77716.1 pentapeptide repeat-containing protein [Kosakonia sacchari]
MSKKLKKELVERWNHELDFGINHSLKKENWKDKNTPNSRWVDHPFGTTEEGKIDFRGFPFREPLKYHYLQNIDFSYSLSLNEMTKGYGLSRGGSIISSLVEHCSFVESLMPANLSEKFVGCNFDKAVFDSTRINALFESCTFIKCKIKNVLGEMRFINCNFVGANLKKSNFYSCYFENCQFDEANFSGCNISGSTFVGTKPSEAQIASCAVADKLKFM